MPTDYYLVTPSTIRCGRCGIGPYCGTDCLDVDLPDHAAECVALPRARKPAFWAEAIFSLPTFLRTFEFSARIGHLVFGPGCMAISCPADANGNPDERFLLEMAEEIGNDDVVAGIENWRCHLRYRLDGQISPASLVAAENSGLTYRSYFEVDDDARVGINWVPDEGEEGKVRTRRYRIFHGGVDWFRINGDIFKRAGPYPVCAALNFEGGEPMPQAGPRFIQIVVTVLDIFAQAGCMLPRLVKPTTMIACKDVIRREFDDRRTQHIYLAFSTPWHAVAVFFSYRPPGAPLEDPDPELHCFHQVVAGVCPTPPPPRNRFHVHPWAAPAWLTIPCVSHGKS